ncbi:uncharacterized protein LOC131962426 [Centropristis striata]|uniref:uncharacterized protein LOC131962426 n=1 Tax=Centropristis striata TaxID=184440 RepID=UPI0027E130E5|nr:uncharacterized protein LOC131962426 [Centropristis striata]
MDIAYFLTTKIREMDSGRKEDKTMPKGGSKCFKQSFVFLLLIISSFVVPVTGFSLKSCRISYNVAICSRNKLSTVPRDIPSTVTGLDLSENRFAKLQSGDFKNLSFVTELDLRRNYITQLGARAFVGLISLKKLNLNNNRLSKLGDYVFDGLGNLTELTMFRNHMKTVASTSFKSLTSLRFLDLSNNKLSHMTKVHSIIQHLPNLWKLFLENNNIENFQSWVLTNSSLKLAYLDLSQNPIEVFWITADVFPDLTWLKIGGGSKKLHMKWDIRNETFVRQVSALDISELQIDSEDMKMLRGIFNSSVISLKMNAMRRTHLTTIVNISCTFPMISRLQLRRNNFFTVSENLLQLCVNVTDLDLAGNTIRTIHDDAFRSLRGLRILSLTQNKLTSVPTSMRNIPTLVELDLSKNNITSLGCYDFANLTNLRQLSLHQNLITALQECVFKDLTGLRVLKLQLNGLSKFNGAFKRHLPNLEQLHLHGNKITAIRRGELKGLDFLKNLSLQQNPIRTIENGSFINLTCLTDIELQTNNIIKDALQNGGFNDLVNLKRLNLEDNHIKYTDTEPLSHPPFSRLSNLDTLSINGQHSRGKSRLPCNFLQGLTNLLLFNARNIQLLSLHKDTFIYTPRLRNLDISSNDLMNLDADLFFPIRSLLSLYISRTSLQSLDFLIEANLTNLEFLQGRKNQYSVLSKEVFESLPALDYLDIEGNSFICDCDNAWFLEWAANNKQTQVADAYNFSCNYPTDLKGMKLMDLDVQSCTVNVEFICYISTMCTILLFMVASFTYHFLRWQLAYAYYLFLALLFDAKHKDKPAHDQYDAFISYNTDDEPWVIRELLPKLEGEQGWRLCLHHRDFEPGKPIIENITDAIYGSRKTICVISRRYLESEWCSREIQVASFRLFDEKKDVLILVFLEDIPTSHMSPYYRMRKLLKRQTYLSWPRAGEHPELFWEKLRQALKTTDNLGDDRFHLTVMDRPSDYELRNCNSLFMDIAYFLTTKIREMDSGRKEDKTMPKGGSKCFLQSFIFLLLIISSFVVPVTGFSLKSCRISYNVAICSGKKLSTVPRDIPSTVTGLDLSENRFAKLQSGDFKNLSFVTELDLKRNSITQLDARAFAGLISLKKLNLNNNRLSKLGDYVFDGLGNLTELTMFRNHMKTVASTSFKSLTSLRVLDLSNNKLSHMTKVHSIIQHLPNLWKLLLENNNIEKFQSWVLTNSSLKLAYLDLSQNPIEVFRITADVFPDLTWLRIGGGSKKLHMKWDIRNETFVRQVSALDISELQLDSEDMKMLRGIFNSSVISLKMNAMRKTHLTTIVNISCTFPMMSSLQLRRNNFFTVSENLLQLCVNVTDLDLAGNKIRTVHDEAFRSLRGLRILSLTQNKLTSVPTSMRNIPTLVELDLSKNNITSLGCYDFANLTNLRQLSLHQNLITALQECVFKDLTGLRVLKLQLNGLSKFNGAFKRHLPNLEQLRLHGNKITTIGRGELKGLYSLKNLSLHENPIRTIENGSFINLTCLTDIQLQTNNIVKDALQNGGFNDLVNLKKLNLADNHIQYLETEALSHPPFSRLSNLETLSINAQHRRGKSRLPCNFLQGLTNLLLFNAGNNQLLSLHKDTFIYTPRLQTLYIRSNELMNLDADLFFPIRSLLSLYISRTSLQSLDFLIEANLTNLEFLQGRKNQYSVLSKEVFESLPALNYLDIEGNSFTCDCDNAWFLQWAANNNQTQVADAYNFSCNYPTDLKGMKLMDLDVQSCTVNVEFICYISTMCTILLFMVASFTYHFLRWQLAYAYYLFLALLFDAKHKDKPAHYQYDAFISYNTDDEPWVIRELLPKLEGEQGWRLCLHHRDFEPGKPIIENITDAIYGSRKTICVISRRYLESEWCSREIQMASFRLFDEQKDVLILVFLEDIPTSHMSPYYRMRKLLKRQTYLSWPRAGEHPELFWEKLRQALKTTDNLGDDRSHLTVMDRP